MCVVSMITDHYHDRYPKWERFPPSDYPDYQELLRKARLYDEMMKQKDCPSREKEEWQKKLEEFMKKQYGLEPK